MLAVHIWLAELTAAKEVGMSIGAAPNFSIVLHQCCLRFTISTYYCQKASTAAFI
jgi:hypothetical protein